ncbi:unnamed protein product, partial [Brassica rapa]
IVILHKSPLYVRCFTVTDYCYAPQRTRDLWFGIHVQGIKPRDSFLADEQSKTLVYCNQSSKNNKIVHIVRGDTFVNVDPLDRSSTIRPSSSSSLLLNYVPSLVQIKQGKN